MPPKNIRKKKWLMEQKKLIASKLMKISLKLDDYIYKNRPISMQEAKTYAEEIAQLKIKCTDVRSLQVSEKLTSIVKSIIGKQYSNDIISAEDTTTPLQLNKDSEAINEKKQINYISDQIINTENASQPGKVPEINDISSNLNISKDVDNTVAAVNIIQCKDRAENISVITTTENLNVDIHHTSAPIENVAKDIQSEQMATEMNNDNINLNKIDDNPSISIDEETNNICKKCNKVSIHINEETINNIVKESVNVNVTSTITNINDQLNKPISDNKSNPSENKRQEMISQNPKPKKKTVRKKKDKVATNFNPLNEKANKNNTRPNTNLKSSAKKSKKKKEIIDLSWIENIKYVREVNADEHIVTNLQESFWSNLTMPAISNIDFEAE